MDTTDIYLPDELYDHEVARIVRALQCQHRNLDHRREDVHFTFWSGDMLDVGEAVYVDGRLEPQRYGALIGALAMLDPGRWCATDVQAAHVTWVLGEDGGVWPSRTAEKNSASPSCIS